MKHFAVLWVFIFLASLIAWRMLSTPVASPVFKDVVDTPTPATFITKTNQFTIFVPYWGISSTSPKVEAKYSDIVYFGIAADSSGVETSEDGYKKIGMFNKLVSPNQQKLLAVRMLDSNENSKVLADVRIQREIVSKTIAIAKQNDFTGVVMDMEMQSLPFNSIVEQIDKFYDMFYKQTQQHNLGFSTLMYGDLFYRPHPFDLTYLVKDVNKVYIMAYDLHNASGQPGPNFPLSTANTDNTDYNLEKMIGDYKLIVPLRKIAVVFGMFGYDWTVDAQGQTTGRANPLSDLQIQQEIIQLCPQLACALTRDSRSSETKINYTDKQNQRHVVWFEDAQSAQKKFAYLRNQGISNFGYWAYSYF